MTPYDKANQLLEMIVDHMTEYAAGTSVPTRRYVATSEPVVDCESIIVALTAVTQAEGYEAPCNVPTVGTYSIVVARECSNTSNAKGMTNVDETQRVAKIQSDDVETLVAFVNSLPTYVSKSWNIALVITGGLAITSLILTTGID